MWDDSHCGIWVELGFNQAWWGAEVFLWVFEVVLVTGFRLSFDTGTFFKP